MANNTQVGKYVYSNMDLPMYGKILSFLESRKEGASFVTISGQKEMVNAFNGDLNRTQGKVKTALSNLRFRSVIQEVAVSHGYTVWKIANKDDALTLIAEAAKITGKIEQRNAEAVQLVTNDSALVSNNPKKEKVNTMATVKTAKAPRLFKNPETSKIEPFGAGRPSKVKLAYECNAEGQFLNPANAMAFAQQGGKAEDKLTKSELLDLLRKVRAERDEAIAARDQLAEILGEMNEAEKASQDAEVADLDASDENDEDLDVEAEAVDSDEEDEVEATEAE
jgi:hypothetical protein